MTKLFSSCMADPPWLERGGGVIQRGADRHYGLMKTDDICALPVSEIMAPDAHLYLWVTNNKLLDGVRVMQAWGFKYVTNLVWGKVYPKTRRMLTAVALEDLVTVQQGLGQYFRGSHELLLFGNRGTLPYRTLPDGKRAQHPSLVLEPRGKHSAKPPIFRQIIEKVSHGPYVELFAREAAPGWDRWGNEVESTITLPGVNLSAKAPDLPSGDPSW